MACICKNLFDKSYIKLRKSNTNPEYKCYTQHGNTKLNTCLIYQFKLVIGNPAA